GGEGDDPGGGARTVEAIKELGEVPTAGGAPPDPAVFYQALLALPHLMRSSMQKDLQAGRQPELDAIAGAVLRRGRERGIPTPATAELVRRLGGSQSQNL